MNPLQLAIKAELFEAIFESKSSSRSRHGPSAT